MQWKASVLRGLSLMLWCWDAGQPWRRRRHGSGSEWGALAMRGKAQHWQEDLRTGNEGNRQLVGEKLSHWNNSCCFRVSVLKLSFIPAVKPVHWNCLKLLLLLSNSICWNCWLLTETEKFSMRGKNSFLPGREFSWKFRVWILTWPDLIWLVRSDEIGAWGYGTELRKVITKQKGPDWQGSRLSTINRWRALCMYSTP